MKIGVITIWQINNYGAELQAFALQKKINNIGFDCENIDYPFYKNADHKPDKLSQSDFDLGFANKLKEKLFPLIQKMSVIACIKEDIDRKNKFIEFHQKNTRRSPSRYCSMSALYNAPLEYDVFMVGSDQVWNPRCGTSLQPYFLTFAPPNAKKISYASSFGVSTLLPETIPKYASWLNAFDAISVRERKAVELVRNICGKEAVHVVDPTLLLTKDEWLNIAADQPLTSEPYVLLYDLLPSRQSISLAHRIAQKHNMKILRICRSAGQKVDSEINNLSTAGPAEFLRAFSDASFVVTNSFHGTVFSLLFNGPFYAVIPDRMQNAGRIHSLLDLVGLQSRCVSESEVDHADIAFPIDYSVVNTKLEAERVKSETFLKNALS